MSNDRWLIEEVSPPDDAALAAIERAGGFGDVRTRGHANSPPLAITVHDVVIHDVRKWFGAADIRLDALVAHGQSSDDEQAVYQPRTFRFAGVRDDELLSIDSGGLLIFYGRPADFVDISIVVSRDRRDSDNLDALLSEVATSEPVATATQAIAALALPGAGAALVPPALAAAGRLGDLMYRVMKDISGNSLGLYRGAWLQIRDAFGVGRHPDDRERFEIKDISFRYEIAVEDDEDD